MQQHSLALQKLQFENVKMDLYGHLPSLYLPLNGTLILGQADFILIHEAHDDGTMSEGTFFGYLGRQWLDITHFRTRSPNVLCFDQF